MGQLSWRDQARVLATARVAVGLAVALAPGIAARAWMGKGANQPHVRLALRSVGVRDAALGAGALLAMRHDAPVRGWLEAAATGDAGDGIATLVAWPYLPKASRALILAFAAAGAAYSRQLAVSVSD